MIPFFLLLLQTCQLQCKQILYQHLWEREGGGREGGREGGSEEGGGKEGGREREFNKKIDICGRVHITHATRRRMTNTRI